MGVPKNGWFIVENHNKMDDLGLPPFQETSISGDTFDFIISFCSHWAWKNYVGVVEDHGMLACFPNIFAQRSSDVYHGIAQWSLVGWKGLTYIYICIYIYFFHIEYIDPCRIQFLLINEAGKLFPMFLFVHCPPLNKFR